MSLDSGHTNKYLLKKIIYSLLKDSNTLKETVGMYLFFCVIFIDLTALTKLAINLYCFLLLKLLSILLAFN